MRAIEVTVRGVQTGWGLNNGNITLGEAGRARILNTIKVDPACIKTEGYSPRLLGGGFDGRQVYAETPGGATCILFRTNGCYTKYDCSGSISVVAGTPVKLARGDWAHGDAGRLGKGSDEIWAIRPGQTATFMVLFGGGRRKGYGYRVVHVRSGGEVVMADVGEGEENESPKFQFGNPLDIFSREEIEALVSQLASTNNPNTARRWATLLAPRETF